MEKPELIEAVAQAQSGDESAFQKLYLDTYRSIFYLALRMVKNPEDAEDITQEVSIIVHEKLPELREPAAYYKWVNRITSNQCAAFLRKYRGITKLDDDEEILKLVDDDPLNLPDRAIDDEATRQIILEVIDALPDGQRACVMFYYYQQHTIPQIADMLGINENTVKSRLALARAKIRAALEEKEKKEGIKLYGIPLALTPILRQAMEQMSVPDGLAERMWENISQAISSASPENTTPNAEPPDSHGGIDSGSTAQNVAQPVNAANAVTIGTAATGMALATKIIIGVVAAAVVTAGAIIFPRLVDAPPEDTTPPAVTDTQTPDSSDDTGQRELSDGEQDNTGAVSSYYEGEMLNGKRHGYGVWTYENYRYEGYWEEDIPNGEGTLYETLEIDETLPADMYDQPMETAINGTFVDGAIDGQVVETWFMTSGKKERFVFELDKDGVAEKFRVYSDSGNSAQIIQVGQIRRVPLWMENMN